MALDPCPHCERKFDHDNEGARTSHIMACTGSDPDPDPDSEDADDAKAHANGGAPAPQQARDTQVAPAGDDPVQAVKMDALRDAAEITLTVVDRLFEHKNRLDDAREHRARNADISKTEDYPACECGYQFEPGELDGDEVRCPSCETLWEIDVV